jgi:antitoxin ParD1/3/4
LASGDGSRHPHPAAFANRRWMLIPERPRPFQTIQTGQVHLLNALVLANFARTDRLICMGTMNISLPDSLKEYVDEQVGQCGYGTSSEYVRELIRKDQDRKRLRAIVLQGAASGLADAVDSDYFESLRARVRRSRK